MIWGIPKLPNNSNRIKVSSKIWFRQLQQNLQNWPIAFVVNGMWHSNVSSSKKSGFLGAFHCKKVKAIKTKTLKYWSMSFYTFKIKWKYVLMTRIKIYSPIFFSSLFSFYTGGRVGKVRFLWVVGRLNCGRRLHAVWKKVNTGNRLLIKWVKQSFFSANWV